MARFKLVGDSRVATLRPLCNDGCDVHCITGATLNDIRTYIVEDITMHVNANKTVPTYVVAAGLCDISSINYAPNYRELVQNHIDLNALKGKIDSITQEMKDLGVTLIWCTIPPAYIMRRNRCFYQQGYHSFTNENNYASYQLLHNELVHRFNEHIIEINTNNLVHPPYLHRWVQKIKKGKKLYQFWHLYDGVHPSHWLRLKWSRYIGQILDKNSIYNL